MYYLLFVLLIIVDENQRLKCIEVYKAATFLWNTNHTDYCKQIKRNDTLKRIANAFNIDVSTVKIKMKNLRSHFSKEHLLKENLVQVLMKPTSNRGLRIHLFFIADSSTPRKTVDGEQEHENPENSDFNILTQVSF